MDIVKIPIVEKVGIVQDEKGYPSITRFTNQIQKTDHRYHLCDSYRE